MLKINTTLTYLDISGTGINTKGLQYICDALTINSNLTYLNLYSYNIENEQNIKLINETLKHNTSLTELVIEENYSQRKPPILRTFNLNLLISTFKFKS